jgi:predicted NAD/FAD-binding protein
MRESQLGGSKIAVIGSGISGLAAAWALSKKYQVTVFESNNYLGGHANTAVCIHKGERFVTDTGFIVFNDRNYPHLNMLFDRLKVPIENSNMSFSASFPQRDLEYSGGDLKGLFAQKKNLLRPYFWRMLIDIARFYRKSEEYMRRELNNVSIGQLLAAENYSAAFLNSHLIPMASAIWSSANDQILSYPAQSFLNFFENHGLLKITDRPQWKTVRGGSKEYVNRLVADANFEIRARTEISDVTRCNGLVICKDSEGKSESFDSVVIATHADQALAILSDPSEHEIKTLSPFKYSTNNAWLHQDVRLMPKRRNAWASWNYIESKQESANCASVTYWMNQLQNIVRPKNIFVSLNPAITPKAENVIEKYVYTHPLFTQDTLEAQIRSIEIQGKNNTWFCGSYLGHGFHEDGIQAGLWVAQQFKSGPNWLPSIPWDRIPRSYDQ